MSIPQNRQINLRPGLRQLAIELDGPMDEKRLSKLRGVVRVLDSLCGVLGRDYVRDDQVLHKEFERLAADVHKKRKHDVVADMSMMMSTMLEMSNDNVLAVSRVDCARVLAAALASVEEILHMPKPPTTYLDEAKGMMHCVCQLMHPDSGFPPEELTFIHDQNGTLENCDLSSVHRLRIHLENIS